MFYSIVQQLHSKSALQSNHLTQTSTFIDLKCTFSKKGEHITVCPGSSDPFYTVTYYIKWVTTSWTYCMFLTIILIYLYQKHRHGTDIIDGISEYN